MLKLFTALMLTLSYSCLAEEDAPVVGKHVAANMDSMSMILSLLMVLAVIVISSYVLKRFQPAIRQSEGIKIVSSVHLGTKERLVVVEVGSQQLLLGVTAGQINLLNTLEEPIKVKPPVSTELGKSLSSLFKGRVLNTSGTKNIESSTSHE